MAVKKKYSIMVIEHTAERELCQCDSNPEAVAQAAKDAKVRLQGRYFKKFNSVRIVENKDAG